MASAPYMQSYTDSPRERLWTAAGSVDSISELCYASTVQTKKLAAYMEGL